MSTATRTGAPDIPGYITWGDGLQLHARSNVHATPEVAAAAGVPWHVVAWTPGELVEAVRPPT